MSRRQKDPLRPLSEAERRSLSRLSRSQIAPAAQVARARALLAVAGGQSYTAAAQLVGRMSATPLRAGWQGSTAVARLHWCRTTVVATRSAMARRNSDAFWRKWPGR